MLQATPLDIAFTTMIIPSDFDAEARHRRRERMPRADEDGVVKRTRPPRRQRSDFFELECENPVTDMANGGPRCASPSRTKRPDANGNGTCPHCMQALSTVAGQGAAGLPYANDEPVHPNSRLVNDMLRTPSHEQIPPVTRSTWQPTAQPPPQPQYHLVETWPFNQVKPEVFYAILVMLGVLVILHMDSPSPSRGLQH
jgi:hypothetical protein